MSALPHAAPGLAAGHPYAVRRERLLPPERVRALSELRPGRVVLDTALCWLAIVSAWAVAATWTHWWTVLPAIAIVGARYYALFVLGHDGMHRRLFRDPRLNDRFCDLFLLGPIGAIVRVHKTNHLEHHRLLATPRDPDRHKHVSADKATRPAFLAFLTGLRNLGPGLRNVFRRRGVEAGAPRPRGGLTALDVSLLLGWQLALAGGLTAVFGWWGYPGMWLLPVYGFSYLPDLIRSFAEHSHPESDGLADRHRLITFDSHPIERFFFAPMNMNRHAAHHLWTSIPYYNLPAADREMRRHPAASALEWRGSYLGYLLRYLRALPLAERRAGVAAAS
jgi:fatty acid desaturase